MAKIIIANWKSHPATLSEALKLARASDIKTAVIAPPYPYLKKVGTLLKKAALGSQDLEASPSELKSLKVKYVIIGHSDRRRLGDTDAIINKKARRALRAGLKVVLCVGENKATRRKGLSAAKKFVANQLKKDLAGIRASRFMLRDSLTIAYEPIWAISTSKGSRADTPKNAAEMISFIRDFLHSKLEIRNSKLLYGGSVTPKNAKSFLSQPGVDGALVGGASLNPRSFHAIIKAR